MDRDGLRDAASGEALPARVRLSWPRALLLAVAVCYAPFAALTAVFQFVVSCEHCKQAAWTVLPFGPGFLPASMIVPTLDPPLTEPTRTILAAFLSVLLVLVTAVLVRRTDGTRRLVVASLVLAGCSIAAIALYHLIRM